ncbi:hypothetical protein C2S51_018659 [Perilla frutescens var. frutescens]|nr:hypothetical protein C2S51_018659 [Perilla frutescens var. frutescens]
MAEGAALTLLLERVMEALKRSKDLRSGAKKEFEQLNDELSLLKAILKDAGSKLNKDATFIELEKLIRKVVYEVEDTVDACLTEAATIKAKNAVARSDFGNTIGTAQDEQPAKIKKDQTVRQDKLVGFQDEEETIMKYMMEETETLEVISIGGMPGLGKTTLAWKIYENQTIVEQFPTRIWVFVSKEFNNRNMFLSILKKFTTQDVSGLDDENLGQTVRACLEKQRFLIVLDDVWSGEVWGAIKDVLPHSNINGNGKILMTSRHSDICFNTYPASSRVHILRYLSEEESWKLLQLEVFNNDKSCPPELQGVGALIANKCRGVPLTIVVIGGILRDIMAKTQTTAVVKEWENVFENLDKFLQEDRVQLLSKENESGEF